MYTRCNSLSNNDNDMQEFCVAGYFVTKAQAMREVSECIGFNVPLDT